MCTFLLCAVFTHLSVIHIVNDSFEHVCACSFPPKLMFFDAEHTAVTRIVSKCFSHLATLLLVSLTYNKIDSVASYGLESLDQLKLVNMSQNPIDYLSKYFMIDCPKITILSLQGTHVTLKDATAVSELSLYFLEVSTFHMCCFAHFETKCRLKPPWYKSCSRLIPNNAIRVLFICVSVCALICIVASLSLHIANRMKHPKEFTVSVIFVNANDALCFVYLMIIWVSDAQHSDNFQLIERDWGSVADVMLPSSCSCGFLFKLH